MLLTRAVALVTRVAAMPHPALGAPKRQEEASGQDWLSEQFDIGLRELNEWLVAVASTSGEEAIGAVDVKELPAGIPFFITDPHGDVSDTSPPIPALSLLLLHMADNDVVADLAPEVMVPVRDVTRLQRSRGHPFLPYAEAITAARRSHRHGRFAQAVLEAGTAVEILVSAAIREAAGAQGVPRERIDGTASAPLRNQLEHHLPRIGVTVDLSGGDDAVAAWYRGAYKLRNRVVHEGYRPTAPEAARPLEEARAVLIAIGHALHGDRATRAVGEMLVVFKTDEHVA